MIYLICLNSNAADKSTVSKTFIDQLHRYLPHFVDPTILYNGQSSWYH